MIFRDQKKPAPKVFTQMRVLKVDDSTISIEVGGRRYYAHAGDFSKALALGQEIDVEVR